MGRPSLAGQRKAEILDAFGRCVARLGLKGSSLEKIAEEAGMRRSILRHYIGNRDELVDALAEKVVGDYRSYTQAAFQLPEIASDRKGWLIDFLLPTQSIGTTEQLLVLEALIGAASQYPRVRELVFDYVDEFIGLIAKQLKLISPDSSRKRCWEVSFGLVSLSFNQESLRPLDLPPRYLRAARAMADSMITQRL